MQPRPITMESDVMDPAKTANSVAELARAHGRRVYLAAYQVLGDAALAEDVQQNVFLALLEKPRAGIESWPAYLSTAATRAAIDELRRRARWSRLTPAWLAQVKDEARSPEALTSDEQRAGSLRRALGRISARDATCFALRYFQGMDIADIARTLELTDNHVSVTLHRAVKSLKAALPEDERIIREKQS